jgi:hypothetical protein
MALGTSANGFAKKELLLLDRKLAIQSSYSRYRSHLNAKPKFALSGSNRGRYTCARQVMRFSE